MNPLYESASVLASFEGDSNQGGQPAGQPNPDPTPPAADGKRFTQDDLNSLLATDRRKHQQKIDNLQAALEQAATSKNLTLQERETLEQQIDTLKKEPMTAQERAQHEKKQLETQWQKRVTDAEGREKDWRQRFEEQTIRSVIEDASHKAGCFSPSQVVSLLGPNAKVIVAEDGKTCKVEVAVEDADGNKVVTNPRDALKTLQANPAKWGNLFKTGVVSGIGSGSGQGDPMKPGGKIDVTKLTMQQYLDVREKNPELLGLRRPKNNGRRL
jgi:hypothetical protein